jgi:hypothetical protein
MGLQAHHVRFKSSFFIKTYVEIILGTFKFTKVPRSQKYENGIFLPCRVIIKIKGILVKNPYNNLYNSIMMEYCTINYKEHRCILDASASRSYCMGAKLHNKTWIESSSGCSWMYVRDAPSMRHFLRRSRQTNPIKACALQVASNIKGVFSFFTNKSMINVNSPPHGSLNGTF